MRSATLLVVLPSLLWVLPAGAAKLYFVDTARAKVQRADLDGTNLVDLVVSPITTGPIGIAVDPLNNKVYWTDQEPNNSRVMRSDLDGSNPETLIAHPTPVIIGFPFGVAVDPGGGKFYWTDIFAGLGRLRRANFDGADVEDIVIAEFIHAVALDLVNSKVYWTEFGGTTKIRKANLDGTSPEDVLTTGTAGLSQLQGLALDIAGGKMYWADTTAAEIRRANLDGGDNEPLLSPFDTLGGIALDLAGGKMYWADAGTDKIQRANLDGSDVEDILTSADGLSFPRGLVVGPDPPPAIPALQAPAFVALLSLLLATGAASLRTRKRTLHSRK